MIDAVSVRGSAREVVGFAGPLVVVMVAAALALRMLDEVPRWIGGEQRGVIRYESVEAAERALGGRILQPAYFPDTLRWPPSAIRLHRGPPPAVALTFLARDEAAERLIMVEALGARAAIPEALMPRGVVLHRAAVPVAEGEAVMHRVQMPGGVMRNDLIWHRADATIALRYAGPAEELVTLARSLQRRRP